MPHKNLIILLFLSTVLLMQGCTTNKQNETINIGVVLPLSGELASFGKTVLNGCQLAVENYNNMAKSHKVSLVVEDSKAAPATAVSSLNKLINIDKVKFVIGDLTSSGTLAMAPIAKNNKVLLLSPTASNPALSGSGEYFLRVWPSDNYSGFITANYSYNKLLKHNAAVIYINNDYGTGLKNVFVQTFQGLGGTVSIIEAYEQNQSDFRTVLTKIKQTKIDIIYVPGHPYGIANVLKESIEMGLHYTYFSDVAAEDKEFKTIAGKAAEGLYFVTPSFDANSSDALVKTFVNDYKNKYGDIPDIHAVKGYESAYVLLSGIQEEQLNPEEMGKYLKSKLFHTMSGDLKFDENGDVKTGMAIKQYDSTLLIKIVEIFGNDK